MSTIPAVTATRIAVAETPSILETVLAWLFAWHHATRSRAMLAELDDRMLADIGISRADAQREVEKPFWR
jgi:uncharacterized protein YjiS (DUF1127 family)